MPLHDVSSGTLTDVRCRVFNSTMFHVPFNVNTAVTFDSEDFDPQNMHSTSTDTSRINIPVSGRYWVYAHTLWNTADSGGSFLGVLKNGGGGWTGLQSIRMDSGANKAYRTCSGIVTLQAGEYVELMANTALGGGVDMSSVNFTGPEFEVMLLARLG